MCPSSSRLFAVLLLLLREFRMVNHALLSNRDASEWEMEKMKVLPAFSPPHPAANNNDRFVNTKLLIIIMLGGLEECLRAFTLESLSVVTRVINTRAVWDWKKKLILTWSSQILRPSSRQKNCFRKPFGSIWFNVNHKLKSQIKCNKYQTTEINRFPMKRWRWLTKFSSRQEL